ITGGENVSSIEVEDCLFQHPAVAEVAVIGVPDEKWGETIKALVVLRPGQQATERDLIDFTRGRMAHFKCPTAIEFRNELPRTAWPSGGCSATSTGVPGCISPRGRSLAPLALRSTVWHRRRRLPAWTQAVHDTPARE